MVTQGGVGGMFVMLDLSGFKLTFSEEFNSRSISQNGEATTWSSVRPDWRLDEHSDIGFGGTSFVDPSSGYDPFSVRNGALSITAVPDRTPYGFDGSWESGIIHTRNSFAQTYGYFEMRADLSSTPGSWDAFWLLPLTHTSKEGSDRWQELDIVEHYGDYDQGVYRWIHTTDEHANPNRDLQVFSNEPEQVSGYHTYGMMWTKESLDFYFNGCLVGSRPTPSDMHNPMFILADLATTDKRGTASDPITMKIDYIRAFSSSPAAEAASQGAVSAPDGRDPGLYGSAAANAPTITSHGGKASASLVRPENTTSVAKLEAADSDGDRLAWSLSGKDAAFFSIHARTGAISFKQAPDFEAPRDANKDNIFNVKARTSNGMHADEQVLTIRVANVAGVRKSGTNGDDKLSGTPEADTLNGRGGGDTLRGGSGDDVLSGMTGNDRLFGGAGADKLKGGDGRDRFVFTSLSDSAPGSAKRDTISDFGKHDRFDLRSIDADAKHAGNQAFSFIGEKGFTGKAGQLHYRQAGDATFVEADANGDRKADMAIKLLGSHDLGAGDFFL